MQTSETSRTQAAGPTDRSRPHQRADEPARVSASGGETGGVAAPGSYNSPEAILFRFAMSLLAQERN